MHCNVIKLIFPFLKLLVFPGHCAEDFLEIPLVSYYHTAHLCIVRVPYDIDCSLGLIDEGSQLNLPMVPIKDLPTKKTIQRAVKERFKLKIHQKDIHPFLHIETIHDHKKHIEDYFILPIFPTTPSQNLLFENISDSTVFYPDRFKIIRKKPLGNFARLSKIQSFLAHGISGTLESAPHSEILTPLLATYGPQARGLLTLSPDLFKFFAKQCIRQENGGDCTLFQDPRKHKIGNT